MKLTPEQISDIYKLSGPLEQIFLAGLLELRTKRNQTKVHQIIKTYAKRKGIL